MVICECLFSIRHKLPNLEAGFLTERYGMSAQYLIKSKYQ